MYMHSVCRLYSGKRMRAQCLRTVIVPRPVALGFFIMGNNLQRVATGVVLRLLEFFCEFFCNFWRFLESFGTFFGSFSCKTFLKIFPKKIAKKSQTPFWCAQDTVDAEHDDAPAGPPEGHMRQRALECVVQGEPHRHTFHFAGRGGTDRRQTSKEAVSRLTCACA